MRRSWRGPHRTRPVGVRRLKKKCEKARGAVRGATQTTRRPNIVDNDLPGRENEVVLQLGRSEKSVREALVEEKKGVDRPTRDGRNARDSARKGRVHYSSAILLRWGQK